MALSLYTMPGTLNQTPHNFSIGWKPNIFSLGPPLRLAWTICPKSQALDHDISSLPRTPSLGP